MDPETTATDRQFVGDGPADVLEIGLRR